MPAAARGEMPLDHSTSCSSPHASFSACLDTEAPVGLRGTILSFRSFTSSLCLSVVLCHMYAAPRTRQARPEEGGVRWPGMILAIMD